MGPPGPSATPSPGRSPGLSAAPGPPPSATPSPTLLLTKCATPAQLRSALPSPSRSPSRSPVRSAPPSLTRSQGLPVLRSLLLLRPPLPTLPLVLLLPATVLESLATLLESPLWLLLVLAMPFKSISFHNYYSYKIELVNKR